MRIILASSSPRRQLLLKQIGLEFEIMTDDTPEENDPAVSPEDLVSINSAKKARNILERSEGSVLIIAADTIVSLDGVIMGKPADKEAAAVMLRRISGRAHTVYTGICLLKRTVPPALRGKEKTAAPEEINFVNTAEVYMGRMTKHEIDLYIETGEPMDKAGAYAIQGLGSVFVEKIHGDYYTVMGLPLARLYKELKRLGALSGPLELGGAIYEV